MEKVQNYMPHGQSWNGEWDSEEDGLRTDTDRYGLGTDEEESVGTGG